VTDKDVLPYLQKQLPDFTPTGEPTRLPEGNLNVVWRVPGAERSVIVKYAPPYIAADPDTPLDPSRLTIEARCLDALGPEGPLADVTQPSMCTPRVLDFNEDDHVLIMEDLGELPTLGWWLRTDDPDAIRERAPVLGQRLGTFIGTLHATTTNDAACADTFDNRPMQETRQAVQYQGVADMLKTGNVPDAEELGARAKALGEDLLGTGRCLTMGDLWPPSVLVADDALYLIDWELAHYGRPLQDVAHFLAHLWMQSHRAPSPAVADAVGSLRASFLDAYEHALGNAAEALWPEQERRDAAIHFGAEILVRAVGPFQAGSLYDGLAPDHPAVEEAVTTAAQHLRGDESVRLSPPLKQERPIQ
jgi:5-methylthioribose kinase